MPKSQNYLWYFLAIILLAVIGLILPKDLSWYFLTGLITVLLLIFFIRYTETGIYLIAFLYPFIYFQFVYYSVNIPYVDLAGLLVFSAWVIKSFILYFSGKEKLGPKNFPGWILMSLFIAAAFLSLISAERDVFWYSLKYIFRPLIFFYLVYVAMPFNVIDSLKKLFRTFKVMFILGIGLSLMGIWSLIFPPIEGLRRVIPIAILGIYPLGTNHNLMAEVFVAIIPLALILFYYEKNLVWKNVYLLGAFLMIAINLLTLSRAGWLALIVEIFILIVLKFRREIQKFVFSPITLIMIILAIPVLYLMYQLATSPIILSSNLNRLKLIEVALTLLKENPLLGAGAGTFTINLWKFQWYIAEYGGVLDAHGFLFKTLAETGILGAAAFVSLLVYMVYILYKGYLKSRKTKYDWLVLGLLIAVSGEITFQLFNTSYFLAQLWLPVGLALASLKICRLGFK